MSRYARQIILDEIGDAGQQKLASASVLVIGAGGLGCPALQYLAAAGVGHLGIADFDVVDESNLQRQILFTSDQVGQGKAQAAKDRLLAINPEIKITIYDEGLHSDNVQALFNAYDIIIDGTDNFESKYLINDAGVKFSKPVIFGAINKYEGQVAVFDTVSGSSCYRCLYPAKPKGYVPNCAEAGVIGAVAGIVGTAQAMEAIKLIVGHEDFDVLRGLLFSIDLKTMRTRQLSIPKHDQCPVCTKAADEIILPEHLPPDQGEQCVMITEMKAAEAQERLHEFYVLDVREQDEWDAGHIEGADLFPLSKMMEGEMPSLPSDKTTLIYCRSGKRSAQAAFMLRVKGHDDLINMSDGYLGWVAL